MIAVVFWAIKDVLSVARGEKCGRPICSNKAIELHKSNT